MSDPSAPAVPTGLTRPQRDPVSVTAFVLSLTIALSVVGLILGLVGLRRTRGGRRTARWAAIAAVPLGLLGTAGLVVGTYVVLDRVTSTVTVANAEVGDCLDIEYHVPVAELVRKDCSGDHQAEVFATGSLAGTDVSAASGTFDVCEPRIPDDFREAFDATLEPITMQLFADAADPDERFICVFQRSVGSFSTPLRG